MPDMTRLRTDYESIEIPEELDFVIEQAVNKGRRARRLHMLRPLAAVAAVLLVFLLSVNFSPVFASYIGNLTGMESFINFIRFDKSLSRGIEGGIGQVINKSITDQGITFSVESAVYDGRNLMFVYDLANDKDQQLNLNDVSLIDDKGNEIAASMSFTYFAGKGFVEIWDIDKTVPENLTIHVKSVLHGAEVIHGNWSIAMALDTKLIEAPQIIELNKHLVIGEVKLTLDSLHIYPTVIDLLINSEDTFSFINAKIVDEAGNELKSVGSSGNRVHFPSNYFLNTQELTLVIDGLYTSPENSFLEIDIANQQIIDDGGFAFEFLHVDESVHPIKGREVNFWFSLNDSLTDQNFLSLEWWGYDQKGDRLEHNGIVRSGGKYAIAFDFDNVPERFKVEIQWISAHGVFEPLQIKIK